MAKLVARTWEWDGAKWNLVLDHIFYGKTRAEAKHYYESHLQTDKFLSDCVEKGKFARRVVCFTDTWYE